MIETCETCKFQKDGDCHRYPPTVMHGIQREWYADIQTMTVFPEATYFCGEWKPIPGPDDGSDDEAVEVPFKGCQKCKWLELAKMDSKCDRGHEMGFFNCVEDKDND